MVRRPALCTDSRSIGAPRTSGASAKSSVTSEGRAASFSGERHSGWPSQTSICAGGWPISLPASSALAVSRLACSVSPAAQPVPDHSPVRTVRQSSEASTDQRPSRSGSTSCPGHSASTRMPCDLKAASTASTQWLSMTPSTRWPSDCTGPGTIRQRAGSCSTYSSMMLGSACFRRLPESGGTGTVMSVTSRASATSQTWRMPSSASSDTGRRTGSSSLPMCAWNTGRPLLRTASPALRGGNQMTAWCRFSCCDAISPVHPLH